MDETVCVKPEELPVLFHGSEAFAHVTSPDYHSYGLVHTHEWPSRRCSLRVTSAQAAAEGGE